MKSNSALNKFTKETPELMKRRAEQQLVVNEFNDARSQVIRRLFDQTALYQELFDKNQTMGNTLIESDINKSVTKYLKSLELAKVKVEENKTKPFNDVFGAYSNAVTNINAYINSTGQRPAIAKNYMQTLASSAPVLLELYNLGLQKISGDTGNLQTNIEQPKQAEPKPEIIKSDAEKEAERKAKKEAEKEAEKTNEEYNKLIQDIDEVLQGQGKKSKGGRKLAKTKKENVPKSLDVSEEIIKSKITTRDLADLFLLYEKVRSSYETGQAIADINLAGIIGEDKQTRDRLEKDIEKYISNNKPKIKVIEKKAPEEEKEEEEEAPIEGQGRKIRNTKGHPRGLKTNRTLERNYELISEWSYPSFVPPSKPDIPLFKNPRSRVNNRIEANGKKKAKKCGKPTYKEI